MLRLPRLGVTARPAPTRGHRGVPGRPAAAGERARMAGRRRPGAETPARPARLATPRRRIVSSCWYAEVDERLACTVHCVFYPCERDGWPADPHPIHIVVDPGAEAAAHEQWHLACAARRPLLRHTGLIDGDSRHVIDDTGSCWCTPTRVEPDDTSTAPQEASA